MLWSVDQTFPTILFHFCQSFFLLLNVGFLLHLFRISGTLAGPGLRCPSCEQRESHICPSVSAAEPVLNWIQHDIVCSCAAYLRHISQTSCRVVSRRVWPHVHLQDWLVMVSVRLAYYWSCSVTCHSGVSKLTYLTVLSFCRHVALERVAHMWTTSKQAVKESKRNERQHRKSFRYWEFNDHFCCMPLLTIELSLLLRTPQHRLPILFSGQQPKITPSSGDCRTPSYTWFLGPTWVSPPPKRNLDRFSRFCSAR